MLRPCLGSPEGPCPTGALSPRSRCTRCSSAQERARPSRRVRGRYDNKHDKLRAITLRERPWCSNCKAPDSPANPLQADHIVPHDRGGKNVRSNYQTLCRACNAAKRNREGWGIGGSNL